MPVFLTSSDADFEQSFTALLGAKREDSPDVDAIVADIIADVRHRGDAALLELTEKFDRLALKDADALRISAAEVDAAIATVSDAERSALELAADRIRAYHAEQMPENKTWTDASGATLGWRWSAPRCGWWASSSNGSAIGSLRGSRRIRPMQAR